MKMTDASAPGFSGLGRPRDIHQLFGPELRRRAAPAGVAGLAERLLGAAPTGDAVAATRKDVERTPEEILVDRITLGRTAVELERIGRQGYFPYRDRQLDYERLDDEPLEEILRAAFPTLEMSALEIAIRYGNNQEVPIFELILATIYRSLYSPRQLFERMAIFWSDHFNIDVVADLQPIFKPVDDREVVRRHALGRFPDLLRASARSPAMLTYLTNDSNTRGHPNENYARELMELHTMGVDGGYSQEDVREVARCFTGWTVSPFDNPQAGRFLFDPRQHDNGEKVVLGHRIPAGGGIRDGERVLEILAAHPATARFVSAKMLRYLWGYEPTERMIDQVSQVYLDTGGDIRAMLRSILRRRWMARATPKLKRPYHAIISALRATFASVENPFYVAVETALGGQLPFNWAPPNGYPDSRGYWTGFMLPRWNFASTVVLDGVGVDMAIDDFLNAGLRPAVLTRRIDQLVFNRRMSFATRHAVRSFLQAEPVTPLRVRQALGLALSAPDFQDY